MTEFSGGWGEEFDGNSVLVHVKRLQYIYIGEHVSRIRTKHPIETYVSHVGNSDVPYPFAIDSIGRYYLFIEGVIIKENTIPAKYHDDPYTYYYKQHNIRELPNDDSKDVPAELGEQPPALRAPSSVKRKWFLGDEEFNMTWTPYPKKNYRRLTEDGDKMYTLHPSGEEEAITKEKYVSIMKRLGKSAGFTTLKQSMLYEK